MAAFCLAERNHLGNFGRGSPKEHSCEIISKFIQWPRRRCRFKVILFLAPVAILFSGAKPLGNFGRGSPKEHSCKIISNSIHRFRRCLLSKLLTDGRRMMDEPVTKAFLLFLKEKF